MLRLVRLAVAVVAAVLCSAGRATSQSPPVRAKLDNGLDVIVVENHAAALATALVAVRSGAFIQEPGDEGLAHLYEHVVFRGYGSSPGMFEADVAHLNGTFNGSTSTEVVTYYLMVPSAKAPNAIGILARALMGVHFDARDLKEELPIVLDELARDEADPEGVLARRVSQQLWGDAWYRKDVSGDSASVVRLSIDRLHQVYERYYFPNNAALIVTGDVSAPAVIDLARREFGDWKAGVDSFVRRRPPPVPPLAGNPVVAVGGSMQDVTVLIAFRGPGLRTDTAATYAADVLFEALNQPGSGLQQRLVNSGLFQSVRFSYETLNEAGPITIRAKTTNQDAVKALTALLDELDRLPGLTPGDLAVGAKRREVSGALAWEEAATLAPTLASWWASGGIDYYLTYLQRTDAVSLDDLRAFAHTYLTGAPRVIGVLGAQAVADRLAAWLRARKGQGP